MASPLVYRGRLYLIRNDGILTCREAASGKQIYQERLSAPGGYYASPIAADGKIYLASDRGRLTVVAAGDTLRVLARNDFEEAIFATPAITEGAIYVRTGTRVYGFSAMSEDAH